MDNQDEVVSGEAVWLKHGQNDCLLVIDKEGWKRLTILFAENSARLTQARKLYPERPLSALAQRVANDFNALLNPYHPPPLKSESMRRNSGF